MSPPPAQPADRRRIGSAARLAAFMGVLSAVILSITAFGTERAFTNQSVASATRGLVAEVGAYERAIAGAGPGDFEARTVSYLESRGLPGGESLMVRLQAGPRLGSSGSAALLADPVIRQVLDHPPRSSTSYRADLAGTDTLYLVAPIRDGSQDVGTMVVASDLSPLAADRNRVLALALGEALVALVGAVAGSYLVLRRLLREVGRITMTAASIEHGELHHRLGDQGTDDEIGQLATTLDSMLDRLQAAMDVQRRLLSDASHQLRTPLTVARGHLEVLARQPIIDRDDVRETVGVVVDELDHMRALVERLLMLGRALEPDFLQIQQVDLRSFLRDLLDSSQVLAVRYWALAPVPDLVAEVDAAKLRGALLNLIDNAVRATTTADSIEIRVTRGVDGETVVLSVEDSGPGIPPGEMEKVMQRFGQLGNADTDGSGLGLAIVTAVAEAHGGTFAISTSDLGGCRAAISLPATRVSVADPRQPAVV